VALLVPNAATVAAKPPTRESSLASHAELAAHPWAQRANRLGGQASTVHLAQYETNQALRSLPEDFTFDNAASPSPLNSAPRRRAAVCRRHRITLMLKSLNPPFCRNEISLFFCSLSSFEAVLSYRYIKRNKFFRSPCPGHLLLVTGIELNNARLNSQLSWLPEIICCKKIICPMKCPAYRAEVKQFSEVNSDLRRNLNKKNIASSSSWCPRNLARRLRHSRAFARRPSHKPRFQPQPGGKG